MPARVSGSDPCICRTSDTECIEVMMRSQGSGVRSARVLHIRWSGVPGLHAFAARALPTNMCGVGLR
eukprot:12477717-Alexandrium_andersonii.AAC.1